LFSSKVFECVSNKEVVTVCRHIIEVSQYRTFSIFLVTSEADMPFSCVEVVDGDRGGMTKVVLSGDEGNKVEVFLFGATVTSWISGGVERLYLSPNAVFNSAKAIRGGIPLVFPQFGQPCAAMPQHGFARTSLWSWECACCHDCAGDQGRLILRLASSAETETVWGLHAFELTYTITLTSSALQCHLAILNSGTESAFSCHALLHTYLGLPAGSDISDLRATGFKGAHFIDKMADGAVLVEERDVVSVDRETDRIYLAKEEIEDITLSNSNGPFMTVSKSATLKGHSTPVDVVFWNAWEAKSASLPDLGEGAYRSYICVEPGTVSEYVTVEPGTVLTVETKLSVS